jgi:hypothetical protein
MLMCWVPERCTTATEPLQLLVASCSLQLLPHLLNEHMGCGRGCTCCVYNAGFDHLLLLAVLCCVALIAILC